MCVTPLKNPSIFEKISTIKLYDHSIVRYMVWYETIIESLVVYFILGLKSFIPTFGKATHRW
jgi:hypothetical protein